MTQSSKNPSKSQNFRLKLKKFKSDLKLKLLFKVQFLSKYTIETMTPLTAINKQKKISLNTKST